MEFVGKLILVIVAAGAAAWFNAWQKGKDQAFELRKERLIAAATGAWDMYQCLAEAVNPLRPSEAVAQRYAGGAAKLSAALPVAKVDTVRCGRKFLDEVGPRVLQLIVRRTTNPAAAADGIADGLQEAVTHQRAYLDLIFAIRVDIGMSKPSDSKAFIEAASTDHATMDGVIALIRDLAP